MGNSTSTTSDAQDSTGAGRPRLDAAARVVVKVGSSLLVDFETGALNRAWLDALASDLARLQARGQEVILVSSGAIALGRKYLGLERRQRRLEQQQAAAAAGQILLAHGYQEVLGAHGMKVAQLLLTLGDTENRRRYLNARSTLETLLDSGVVPVINENDTVATEEIRYGDNDRLAARVAAMSGATCLVLLSDVAGLFEDDPRKNPSAALIRLVDGITPEIEALAGESLTEYGSGGMITKIAAARICEFAGCATVIADGHQMKPLAAIEAGAPCTWFRASATPGVARKRWIAGTLEPRGAITVDAGAVASLRAGKSLLPVGIIQVEGNFQRGDAVIVKDESGHGLARGLTGYSSSEIKRIRGRQSSELEAVLGYRRRQEVIHRDNLVIISH